jgi:homoserine O-acetyltransferase
MRRVLALLAMVFAFPAAAADYPTPRQADWIAKDFKLHTGEVMPELKLHYTTIGDPKNPAVLMLHGSGQSGTAMLTVEFAGALFGPGQPLDASRYYIILPDGLGHGKSTKPSDGLRTRFPQYDYDDMVQAHYRLLTEGMGVKHLRLVMGNSMGGMQAWLWAGTYPDFMDAAVPMASQPVPMSARNWMLRRMMIESIKADPDYKDGNYTTQPGSLKMAAVFFQTATSGGTLAYARRAPTRAAADRLIDERLAEPLTAYADTNDFIYQWSASGDYDPTPTLSKITTRVLAINAADDERNPPETGLTEKAMQQIKGSRLYLIPASSDTRGHSTTAQARFYASQLAEFLQDLPAVR